MKYSFEGPYFKPPNKQEDKEEVLERASNQENLQAAEIAKQTGDYEEIVQRLKQEGLWEMQLQQTREKFASQIDTEDFPSKEKVIWEILTVLDLYDSETAQHCVKTYHLIKRQVEKITTEHAALAKILENENIELEQFYFASLAHDIGKVCIPPFVISNFLARKNWDQLFLEMAKAGELPQATQVKLGITPSRSYNNAELLQKLSDHELRSKDVVPIKKGLSDYELFCLETQWHLSGEQPLMNIIDQHAQFSEEILRDQGFKATGKLVGQHHHQPGNTVDLVSFKTLDTNSDLAEILHLADVEQALLSKRHYKEAFSELATILQLKQEIENSNIKKTVAYFWLKDKRDQFVKNNDPNSLEKQDKQLLQQLNAYIAQLETEKAKEELKEIAEDYPEN